MIKSIEKLPTQIEARKTIVVSQSLATSNTFTVSLLPYVHFTPRHMIIRQLLYSNIGAGTDNGIYLISTSITGDNIGAVYVGIQGVSLMPESIIPLPMAMNQISFSVSPANAAFTGPTGHLVMTLEFC